MHDLIAQIDQWGRATPGLTALRWGGRAVSFGELRDRLCAYDRVVAEHGMSEHAGLTAALLSLLPDSGRTLDPRVRALWVGDAIAWLDRESEPIGASVTAV